MAEKSDSVFLTETNVKINDFPATEVEDLEALVSGVSQISQSTMLLKKRKEMREVDDAFEFMNEEYELRMDACEEREREFERKQQEMRGQVARFEKFIRENDSKRQRAEAKEKTEQRTNQLNEQKRVHLMQQLVKDQEIMAQLNKRVECLYSYRSYLDRVVDGADGEYEEISDILNRYSTLVDANKDLKHQIDSVEKEMDNLRIKLRATKRDTQNHVLVQNSEIHGHQLRVEHLRAEFLQLDMRREKNEEIMNNRTRESGQIILSLKNLYQRCSCSMRGKVATVKEGNDTIAYMQEILKVFAERMLDLEHIRSNYHPE